MKTEEALLKDEVKDFLKSLGAYFFMYVPSGYGKQTLDFLCCVNGKFVAIETKAPGKKPTPRQQNCIDDINQAGGVALWLDTFEKLPYTLWTHGIITSSQIPKAQ